MNKKQMAAVAQLDMAMKACSDAGLYLYVQSGNLLVYDAKRVDAHKAKGNGDMIDAYRDLSTSPGCVRVPDYNTQIDGGDF